jgi:hypothetical protein
MVLVNYFVHRVTLTATGPSISFTFCIRSLLLTCYLATSINPSIYMMDPSTSELREIEFSGIPCFHFSWQSAWQWRALNLTSVTACLGPNDTVLNTMKNTAQGKSVVACEIGELHITMCFRGAIRTVSQMLPVDFQKGESSGLLGPRGTEWKMQKVNKSQGAFISFGPCEFTNLAVGDQAL